MSRVQAGHERTPGRGANRAAGIVLRETHALGRHAIDVWRLYVLLAVASKVALAEIVRQDEDDVGWSFISGSSSQRE